VEPFGRLRGLENQGEISVCVFSDSIYFSFPNCHSIEKEKESGTANTLVSVFLILILITMIVYSLQHMALLHSHN